MRSPSPSSSPSKLVRLITKTLTPPSRVKISPPCVTTPAKFRAIFGWSVVQLKLNPDNLEAQVAPVGGQQIWQMQIHLCFDITEKGKEQDQTDTTGF